MSGKVWEYFLELVIKRIQKLEKKQISSWRERKEKFLELDREKKFIESDGEEGLQCTSLEQLLETQKTEVMVFWKWRQSIKMFYGYGFGKPCSSMNSDIHVHEKGRLNQFDSVPRILSQIQDLVEYLHIYYE